MKSYAPLMERSAGPSRREPQFARNTENRKQALEAISDDELPFEYPLSVADSPRPISGYGDLVGSQIPPEAEGATIQDAAARDLRGRGDASADREPANDPGDPKSGRDQGEQNPSESTENAESAALTADLGPMAVAGVVMPAQESLTPAEESIVLPGANDALRAANANDGPPLMFSTPAWVALTVPTLGREETQRLERETGMGLAAHVGRINDAGEALRHDIMAHRDTLSDRSSEAEHELKGATTTALDAVERSSAPVKSEIAYAYDSALVELKALSAACAESVMAARVDATARLTTASVQYKADIAREFTAAIACLDGLLVPLVLPFHTMLAEKSAACLELGEKSGQLARATGEQLAAEYEICTGDPENDLRQKCKSEAAIRAGKALERSLRGCARGRSMKLEAQKAAATLLVAGVLDQLRQALQFRRTLAEQQLDAALASARDKLNREADQIHELLQSLQATAEADAKSGIASGEASVDAAVAAASGELQVLQSQALATLRNLAQQRGENYARFLARFQAAADSVRSRPDWRTVAPEFELLRGEARQTLLADEQQMREKTAAASRALARRGSQGSESAARAGAEATDKSRAFAEAWSTTIGIRTGEICGAIDDSVRMFSQQVDIFVRPLIESAQTVAGEATRSADSMRKGMEQAIDEQLVGFAMELAAQVLTLEAAVERDHVALFERTKAELNGKAVALWNAMDGAGTAVGAVMNALRGLGPIESAYLQYIFADHYHNRHLDDMLVSELSGADLREALAHLSGDRVSATFEALANSIHWYGDDEKGIEAQLRLLSDEDLAELQRQTRDDPAKAAIIERVRANLGGHDLDVTEVLLDQSIGQEARNLDADAIRIHEAMIGPGTGEETVFGKLEGKTPEELAEIERYFAGYHEKKVAEFYGTDRAPAADYSLRNAIDAEMNGAEQDLGFALLDSDKLGQEAARLEIAARGGWFFEAGTDSKAIFDRLKDKNLKRPDPSDPDYAAKQMAYEQARKQRDALEARYLDKYGRSIDEMLGAEMGGYEYELATQYREQGRGDPALSIRYAVSGAGTNEDLIKETLKDLSPAEIEKLRADYAKAYGGSGAPSDLIDQHLGIGKYGKLPDPELSGREQFDVEILMRGKPSTPEEYREIAKLEHEWQRSGSSGLWMDFLGWTGFSNAADQLDWQKSNVDKAADQWAQDGVDSPEGRANVEQLFERYQQDFDSYERTKTEASEAVVTGIELVGAAAVTYFSFGAGSPLLVAVLGSAVTTTATMTTRAMLLGNSYGQEQMNSDGVMFVLDVASAGLGEAKFVEKWAKGLVDGLPPGITARVLEQGLKDLPGNILTSAGATLGNEKNWDDDVALQKLLFAVVAASGTSMSKKYLSEIIPDATTKLSSAFRAGLISAGSDVSGKLLNPESYGADIDDVFWTLGKSGLKAGLKGAVLASITAEQAKRFAQTIESGKVSAEELEAKGDRFSAAEKAYLAEQLTDPSILPNSWKNEIVAYRLARQFDLGPVTKVPERRSPGTGAIKWDDVTKDELEAIHGIGPKRAAAIVDFIDEHGPVITIEELDAAPGIGPATLDLLREHLWLLGSDIAE